MALDPDLAGRTFAPTAPYDVSRHEIAEFAAAVGYPPDADEAPPTFPIVIAFRAMTALMADPEVGIELRNVVHADQRFVSERAIRAGDVLTAQLQIEKLRHMAGTDIVTTRSDITTVEGEHVCSAYATLAHKG
ncbi:FAS1-like dehydratase domain-containing protein [Solicola gregarius]|uniref:MaoC family dehydratase N-terminal domain-containing protein n=1 Tax=Solicola gregarius TaxID=2908642 RepID=A0AA46TE81_9ACTN|nr:MaoC family dehydratase N-terminal domain-containing protein [Solicola gregarius]UYM03706.1 MaoC family dehydratase N-terminal domain-containing protein [Solicola gregarius]